MTREREEEKLFAERRRERDYNWSRSLGPREERCRKNTSAKRKRDYL